MARTHGGNALTPPAVVALLDGLLARDSCAALLDDGEPVVVACSGGADSVALLALALHAGRTVHCVHVDHGLRAGSAEEGREVVALATRLGVASARSVHVRLRTGTNVEAAARDARHAALEGLRLELGATAVLLGHTLDDQAETVLLAVLRGSGMTGLSGMAERRGAIVRPLLGVRRAETLAVCAALGFVALDDPMNHDRRFDRVWLRRELLPALAARSGRDLGVVLARQAAVVREESEYLDRMAQAALSEAGDPPEARALARLDRVVLRRAVRHLVGAPWIGGAAVDGAVEVVVGARRAVALPCGRTLRRTAGHLIVERFATASGTVPIGATSNPSLSEPTELL